jgi:hypothetical protein
MIPALAVGAAISSGVGFLLKRNSTAEIEQLHRIGNEGVLSIRQLTMALRYARDRGMNASVVANMHGYSWAPRDDIITRHENGADKAPARYALLKREEHELVEETNIVKEVRQATDGTKTEVTSHQRVQKDTLLSSVTRGRTLGLIDTTSFQSTGLTAEGHGEVTDEELKRRAAIRETFDFETALQRASAMAQDDEDEKEHNQGYFMEKFPKLRDMVYGKRQTIEEIVAPMYWADPAETGPLDSMERRAGGVWLEIPPKAVPAELFFPMAASVTPAAQNQGGNTNVTVNTVAGAGHEGHAPAAPRVVGHKLTEMAVPVGMPLFVRAHVVLTPQGQFTVAPIPKGDRQVITNQSMREYLQDGVDGARRLNTVGNVLLLAGSGLAASAIAAAVKQYTQE